MRVYIIFCSCFLFIAQGCAKEQNTDSRSDNELIHASEVTSDDVSTDLFSKFELNEAIPEDYLIRRTQYFIDSKYRIRNDISKEIKKRELKYSIHWINKAVNYFLVPKIDLNSLSTCGAVVYYISGVGTYSDDAIFIKWKAGGFLLEAIDSRMLTLLVTKKGLSDKEAIHVFENVAGYKSGLSKKSNSLSYASNKQIVRGKSFGKISVDRGTAGGWFIQPIEWYKIGDSILFAFNKIVRTGNYKGPVVKDEAELIIGGIPQDDDRSYLRFDASNRKQLSLEYLKKLQTKFTRIETKKPDSVGNRWPTEKEQP